MHWTPELLKKAVIGIYQYASKYDSRVLSIDPLEAANNLLSTAETTLALGEGGMVIFSPMVKGHDSQIHIHIWDREWLRRPDIMRAVLRFGFKHWKLNRITGQIPARHTLALKNALGAGFKVEGRLRRSLLYNGGVDDCIVVGVLPEEVEE